MTLLSYACSSSYENEADSRIADLDSSLVPHIVTVDPFNHATARNHGLEHARTIKADWLVWMDTDWILDTCILCGHDIVQGQILHYPTIRSPWRRASVFAIPRAVFTRCPLWDDEHFSLHWADIHWAIVLVKRAGLRIIQSRELRVRHIPHEIRPLNAAWHRAKAFYEADKLRKNYVTPSR